jgi:hypothetical protein
MDTGLTLEAEASAGATVSPTFLATSQIGLRLDESRSVVNHVILLCSEPGKAEFRFNHQIEPALEPDTDPEASNNAAELVLAVECLPADDTRPTEPTHPETPDGVPGALSRIGIDYSVPTADLLSWLSTNPPSTAYPAIVAVILESGWRFTSPIYLDVIVWKYESTRGAESPRYPEDVDVELLKAAILAASNERYGTEVMEFEELLAP